MRSAMLLRRMQNLLAAIYDLPRRYDVHDFVFSDRTALPVELRDSSTDEQVLVRDDGDIASIGVFLDGALLTRLAAADPLRSLDGGNIADYWSALEGVSHFLYLDWNVAHDRAVCLLELELQAEIDKYVASWWLLRAQHPGRHPAELHPLLFEHTRIDAALARDGELYRQANHYAARFCRHLEPRLARTVPERHAVLRELRRFYRLSRERKLDHIRAEGAV